MGNHFRASCEVCGLFIDSAYCKEIEGKGYECSGCKTVCSFDRNQIKPIEVKTYFVEMRHINGKKKDVAGRIHLKRMSIESWIKTAGNYGWHVSSYTPVIKGKEGMEPVVKVDTHTSDK